MTVSTFHGVTGDGYVLSSDAAYATARSGGSLSTSGNLLVGQDTNGINYFCYEGFIGFDTSAVSTDTVSVATLSLWLLNDDSGTDFTCQARLKSWTTGGLTTADWVAGASLTQTLLATLASLGIGATGAYKDFTSDANFISNINGSGNTEIILNSSRHVGNNTPTGGEKLQFDQADTAGTTQDPKLVVTHAASAAGPLIGGKLVGGVLRGRLVR